MKDSTPTPRAIVHCEGGGDSLRFFVKHAPAPPLKQSVELRDFFSDDAFFESRLDELASYCCTLRTLDRPRDCATFMAFCRPCFEPAKGALEVLGELSHPAAAQFAARLLPPLQFLEFVMGPLLSCSISIINAAAADFVAAWL